MKKAMRILELGIKVIFIALAFDAITTVYFLISEGWHLKPNSTPESLCDLLSSSMYICGVLSIVWGLAKLMSKSLRKKK